MEEPKLKVRYTLEMNHDHFQEAVRDWLIKKGHLSKKHRAIPLGALECEGNGVHVSWTLDGDDHEAKITR